MSQPRSYITANLAFGGGLSDWLIASREDGMTFEDILIFLAAERGIRISLSTLRKWIREAYAENTQRLAS